jgi:hypothetical protein
MEMADRTFEQAEGEYVVGAGGKTALRGASHVTVLRCTERDKVPPLREMVPSWRLRSPYPRRGSIFFETASSIACHPPADKRLYR